MAERLLDEVDGRTAVETVARMGMAQSKGVLRFTHENDSYRELFGSGAFHRNVAWLQSSLMGEVTSALSRLGIGPAGRPKRREAF